MGVVCFSDWGGASFISGEVGGKGVPHSGELVSVGGRFEKIVR